MIADDVWLKRAPRKLFFWPPNYPNRLVLIQTPASLSTFQITILQSNPEDIKLRFYSFFSPLRSVQPQSRPDINNS